ncbi:hypothetical protein M2103_002321 [Ereboglobus sp. PH5-5]|uniref:hypothetical protein n=1 Tax=Ereboglobus sp. PH5-5 TaxID=2940529 RepID=UPI002404A1CF|nr:hypothetical protein [Ereboglobus sp. PH5-5]MDF9834084.1 hypothetical protein [Ereboglobus sp. PH5-5]
MTDTTILAYLNSALCDWQFGKICATSGTGTRRWIKQYIEQIRIPFPKPETERRIQQLAMDIGKVTSEEKVNLSAEIDKQIFALSDLTKEEREFVNNCVPIH